MSRGWRNAIVAVFFVWLIGMVGSRAVWPIIPQVMQQVRGITAIAGETQKKAEGTLPVDGATGLQLRTVNGTVQVESIDGKELRYEATIWAKGSDAQRKVEQITVRAEKQGDSLVIESMHPGNGVSNAGVNYIIYLPKELNLQVNVTNGTVSGDLLIAKDHQYSIGLVNGGVELRMQLVTGAELTTSAVNGDFKVKEDGVVKTSGSSSRGHLSATYGEGGAQVTISTVNGAGSISVSQAKW